MKKTGKIIFFGTLFGLLCSFGNAQTVQAQDEIAIEDGVCIGNVDVGGMTEDEAKTAVSSYVDSLSLRVCP